MLTVMMAFMSGLLNRSAWVVGLTPEARYLHWTMDRCWILRFPDSRVDIVYYHDRSLFDHGESIELVHDLQQVLSRRQTAA